MGEITDILKTMDYGPAPEAADAVRAWLDGHKAGFGHFIGGAFTRARRSVRRPRPRRPAKASPASRKARPPTSTPPSPPRAPRSRAGRRSPGHERARHLYALARLVQKRERFLGVLESLDNGKPIRETRDIDMPLVARHFYHHAGWASLIDSEFPQARAGRRLRADHARGTSRC